MENKKNKPKNLTNIKEDIKYSTFNNSLVGQRLAHLQNTNSKFSKRIQIEHERLKQLNLDVSQNDKIIQHMRDTLYKDQKQRGPNDPISLNRNIKSLQAQLDKLNEKKNSLISKNEEIKIVINEKRRDKKIFQTIYAELEKELQIKTNYLQSIIDKNDKARKEIDNAKGTLKKAKLKAKEEEKKFVSQYQNIITQGDIVEKQQINIHKERLDQIRQQNKSQLKLNQQKCIKTPMKGENPYITQIDEQKLKNIQSNQQQNLSLSQRGQLTIAMLENNLKVIKQQVKQHEDVFERLKNETGKKDIKEMVETFVKYEENNYSLFTYINSLSDELQQLIKERKNLQDDIKKKENQLKDKRPEVTSNVENKQKNLKEEIQKCNEQYEIYLKKQQDLKKELFELKECIPKIFQDLECEKEKVYQAEYKNLLDIKEINDNNILQFIAIIERRVFEILQEKSNNPRLFKFQTFNKGNELGIQGGDIQNIKLLSNYEDKQNSRQQTSNLELWKKLISIENEYLQKSDKLEQSQQFNSSLITQSVLKNDLELKSQEILLKEAKNEYKILIENQEANRKKIEHKQQL